MPDGCIYIARNDESDPVNHYKVGKTYNASPERRMQQLSSETTNYRGIYLAKGYVLVNDVDECELKIHRHLNEYRINPNREYFNLHVDEISKAIKTELADKICINRLPEPETIEEFPEEFLIPTYDDELEEESADISNFSSSTYFFSICSIICATSL